VTSREISNGTQHNLRQDIKTYFNNNDNYDDNNDDDKEQQ